MSLKSWTRSVYLLFGFLGLTFMSILVRMPEVKETIGVNTAGLGMVLLGTSLGSIPALLIAGRLIEKFGTRPLILVGFTVMAVANATIPLALLAKSPQLLFAVLAVHGFSMALGDVSINLDGSTIEQRLGRSIMPRLHGGFSVGAFAGTSLGTLAAAVQFPLAIQVAVLAVLTVVVPMLLRGSIPAGTGKHEHNASARGPRENLFKNRILLFLALGIFGITLAEGASNDWLVLGLVDGYHVARPQAGVAFATLTLAMTFARFFGNGLVDKLGRTNALRIFALVGVVGILLVVFSHNLVLGIIGSAFWGVGVALGFPLFISAAGEGKDAARQVSFVTAAGYIAFLVGPPMLGLVGQAIGILQMFLLLAAFMAAAAYFASATKPNQ